MPASSATDMRREFTVVVERDEDGYYVGSVPALAGCHTQARSLDELMERVREAIALCLEEGDGTDFPTLEFVGVQRVSVAA
jgi:predicted RNase H-like HicB family nuclease